MAQVESAIGNFGQKVALPTVASSVECAHAFLGTTRHGQGKYLWKTCQGGRLLFLTVFSPFSRNFRAGKHK